MKNVKKIVALLLCAVLLVGATIAGTVAYLTDSKTVENTFTVGNVTITLDETDVDLYGVKDGETRVIKNEYKLIPGHTYVKDPIIHVTKGSEVCYVYVTITNDISGIEAGTTIAAQLAANGWVELPGVANTYYQATAVDARTAAQDVAVFQTFTVAGTADVAGFKGKSITIVAYAIQADGFSDALAAWAAVHTSANN